VVFNVYAENTHAYHAGEEDNEKNAYEDLCRKGKAVGHGVHRADEAAVAAGIYFFEEISDFFHFARIFLPHRFFGARLCVVGW